MKKIVISVQGEHLFSHRQRISIHPSRFRTVGEFIDIISMELKRDDGSPLILAPGTALAVQDPATGKYEPLVAPLLPTLQDRSRVRICESGWAAAPAGVRLAASIAVAGDAPSLRSQSDAFDFSGLFSPGSPSFDPSAAPQGELQEVLQELLEHHARVVFFLSSRIAAEAEVGAKDVQLADRAHAETARRLVQGLGPTEPLAAMRVVTQLAVKEGKAERELAEAENVKSLRHQLQAARDRVSRVESELSAALHLAETLQGQIHTNASEKEDEMQRLRQEVVALRRLTHEQQVDMSALQKSCSALQRENGTLRSLQEARAVEGAATAAAADQQLARSLHCGALNERPRTAPFAKVVNGLTIKVSGGSGATPRSGRGGAAKPFPTPRLAAAGRPPRAASAAPRAECGGTRSPSSRSPNRSPHRSPVVRPLQSLAASQQHQHQQRHSSFLAKRRTMGGFEGGESSGDEAAASGSPQMLSPTASTAPLAPLEASAAGGTTRPGTDRPSRPPSGRPRGQTAAPLTVQFVDQDGNFISCATTITKQQASSLHLLFEVVVQALLAADVRPLSCRHVKMSYFRHGEKHHFAADEDVEAFFDFDAPLTVNCIEQLNEEPLVSIDHLLGPTATGRGGGGAAAAAFLPTPKAAALRKYSSGRRASTSSAASQQSYHFSHGSAPPPSLLHRTAAATSGATFGCFDAFVPESPSESASLAEDDHVSPWSSSSRRYLRDKSGGNGRLEVMPSAALFLRGSGASLPSDAEMEALFARLGGTRERGVPVADVEAHLHASHDDLGDPQRFKRLLAPFRAGNSTSTSTSTMMSFEQLCVVMLKLAKE